MLLDKTKGTGVNSRYWTRQNKGDGGEFALLNPVPLMASRPFNAPSVTPSNTTLLGRVVGEERTRGEGPVRSGGGSGLGRPLTDPPRQLA